MMIIIIIIVVVVRSSQFYPDVFHQKFYGIFCFTYTCNYTGLFKMIIGGLTTCHTQYT